MIHCHDLEHNGRRRHLTGPSPSPHSFHTQSTPQRDGALHRQVPVRVGRRRLRRFSQSLRDLPAAFPISFKSEMKRNQSRSQKTSLLLFYFSEAMSLDFPRGKDAKECPMMPV
ncbi:hypothetical protein TNIN_112011 [Trichonephila inaurata madagascariensis]|uniref:Uncharacterized protein n=1 Tax=Trichonephila inaurata madagascariensis TaxID=2747483 RepID=A0A8X6X7P9_9ARAC|nr:hypothetical protein TNIN_112011 [Trichonephila inaurata madagascariensis]